MLSVNISFPPQGSRHFNSFCHVLYSFYILCLFFFFGLSFASLLPIAGFYAFTLITPCFVCVFVCTAFSIILSNFLPFILLDNPYLILKHSESSMQSKISLTTFHMQSSSTSILFVFALVAVPK